MISVKINAEGGGNIFGEHADFDGHYGISVYNKTDQFKVEDENSAFFNVFSDEDEDYYEKFL